MRRRMSKAAAAELTRLRKVAARCQAHEPYIPLAEKLRTEISESYASSEEVPRDLIDTVLTRVSEEERQRLAIEAFKALPPEKQLELLERYSDGDPLIDQLRQFCAEELEARSKTSAIEKIRERAEETGRINLLSVPKDARITLGLWDARDYEDMLLEEWHDDDELGWIRQVDAVALGDGNFRILTDRIAEGFGRGNEFWSLPLLTWLGSRTSQEDGSLEPSSELHRGGEVLFGKELLPLNGFEDEELLKLVLIECDIDNVAIMEAAYFE